MYLNNFTKSDNFYIKNKTSSLHERRFALKNKRWKLKKIPKTAIENFIAC